MAGQCSNATTAADGRGFCQAAWSDIQARYCQAPTAAAAATQSKVTRRPGTLPEHSTATYAQLMLLHGAGWVNHSIWQHWQAAHTPSSLALFAHMKAGVTLHPDMPGRDLIARTQLQTSRDSCWGDISLVDATLASMEEVLQRCPNVTHIGLASGHDVPVQLIRPGLLQPGVSLFGAYEFGKPEMHVLRAAVVEDLMLEGCMEQQEAVAWSKALTFHHQWMVLSREHAAALVHHRDHISRVGRLMHASCCSVGAGMAPDEFIIITALKRWGYVRSVRRADLQPGMRVRPGTLLNSHPTFVVFPAESSPHPVLWKQLERKVMCQVEEGDGQQHFELQSLNDCLQLAVERCALFFRKVQICQPRDMLLMLSRLQAMWQAQHNCSSSSGRTSKGSSGSKGKRKHCTNGSSNSSSGSSNGSSNGSSDSSKGRSQHKSKRKHNSSAPSTYGSCGHNTASDVDAFLHHQGSAQTLNRQTLQ